MKSIFTRIITFCFAGILSIGCDHFVEPDKPKTQIVRTAVFDNNQGASAAVYGIYSQMSTSGFSSGNSSAISATMGLSADELTNHSTSASTIALATNNLTPTNSVPVNLWNDLYLNLYQINSAIEGIQSSNSISQNVRNQLLGQVLFLRAFGHFYLVNTWGAVPIATTTDYRVNMTAPRTSVEDVYKQIEDDLAEARRLLAKDYSFTGGERISANFWVATALLARVYLYQQRWTEAQAMATSIIDNSMFKLEPDLTKVFLGNSTEAIWQLRPVIPGVNTNEASYMMITSTPTRVSLNANLFGSFELADKRVTSWIGTYTSGSQSYRYPFKYKVNLRDRPVTEYYMIFRLAEQILIRAEARLRQGMLTEAVADLNLIRGRAGVPAIDPTGLNEAQVFGLLVKERRVELFAEWGHRWFDLKRWGLINDILGSSKPSWTPKAALFPIPQGDINANKNLTQNE